MWSSKACRTFWENHHPSAIAVAAKMPNPLYGLEFRSACPERWRGRAPGSGHVELLPDSRDHREADPELRLQLLV